MKNMFNYPLFTLSLFLSGTLYGQSTFETRFEKVNLDEVIEVSNNEYVATGWNFGDFIWEDPPYTINQGVVLMRTKNNGEVIWSKVYSVDFKDEVTDGQAIAQMPDGGFLIGGACYRCDSTGTYAILIRTNVNGDTIWTKKYSSPVTFGRVRSIITSSDGHFIAAGDIGGWDSDASGFIMKINENGLVIWSKKLISSDYVQIHSLLANPDGSFMIAGNVHYGIAPDLMIAKISPEGDMIWNRTFDASDYDIGFDVCHAHEGGYMLTGGISDVGFGSVDVCLISIDENGSVRWSKLYGGIYGEDGQTILKVEGGYVIGGQSSSFTDPGTTYLIRTDIKGDLEWSRMLGSEYGVASSVISTSDNYLVAAGMEFEMFKLANDGNGYCHGSVPNTLQTSYNVPFGNDSLDLIDISFTSGPTYMKILDGPSETFECQILNTTTVVPNEWIQLSSNIVYDYLTGYITNGYPVEIFITDLSGKVFLTQKLQSNDVSFQIDMASNPPGMYFLSLKFKEGNLVKKFVFVN